MNHRRRRGRGFVDDIDRAALLDILSGVLLRLVLRVHGYAATPNLNDSASPA